MITWQDFERAEDKTKWLRNAIVSYRNSKEFKKAVEEQEYMAGRNVAILNTTRVIYSMAGIPENDFTKANTKIRNRTIHRLVTDRCSYSLGNGISFASKHEEQQEDGTFTIVDATKETMGDKFDRAVYRWAYWALGNGASYLYVHPGYDKDVLEFDLFKKTQFLALYDEKTGDLRGGIRFWCLDWGRRPVNAILYTENGYIRYETPEGKKSISALEPLDQEPRPYVETVKVSEAYGEEISGTGELTTLPIFPLYSGENRESALDNLKPLIDAYDMVLSGFANDIQDCAQVYWLISGAFAMNSEDCKKLLDRLILQHIAVVDGENSNITPFTQEIPYEARKQALQQIKAQMYENYGGFDVHTVEAGATNDHIEAGYLPMDEEADSFEYEIIEAVQKILAMIGIKDTPIFQRNRVSNQREQTEMVMLAAEHLDERTILEKLPFVTVDEVSGILARKDESEARIALPKNDEQDADQDGEGGV